MLFSSFICNSAIKPVQRYMFKGQIIGINIQSDTCKDQDSKLTHIKHCNTFKAYSTQNVCFLEQVQVKVTLFFIIRIEDNLLSKSARPVLYSQFFKHDHDTH